jgi:hypothetical protein
MPVESLVGAQRPRLVTTGGASLLGGPRPILVHDHIEDTGHCDEVRNDDDPVSIDNRPLEELQIYAEPLTDPAAIEAANQYFNDLIAMADPGQASRLPRVFTPFQRIQYLEINNPINTPIVFASMS